MTTELTLYMTREHTLAYASVWNDANRDHMGSYADGAGITRMVFERTPQGIVKVYYDLEELEAVFTRIGEALQADEELIDDIISDFYSYWDELMPYLEGDARIESLEELSEYFENWTKWWAPMAWLFVIPDRVDTAERTKKKALAVREATENYSDDGDRVILEYLRRTHPQLESLFGLATPQELCRIDRLAEAQKQAILARKDGCALITDTTTRIVNSQEYEKELTEHGFELNEPGPDSQEVTGTPASKGVVRGTARIIITKESLSRVQQGDILITHMTSPQYVPAMKQAAAIVTDEGGIVCHAAIVSRELGIPCIIGTKNATRVLKDGDLVEVDAEAGVVRILE